MKIAIMHYADVHNYGDALFPRILKHEIARRIPEVEFAFFAPSSDDCGLRSRRYDSIGNAEAYDAIILGGGEIIHRSDEALKVIYARLNLDCIDRPTDLTFLWEQRWPGAYKAWIGVGIPPATDEVLASIADVSGYLHEVAVRGSRSAWQYNRIHPPKTVRLIPDLGWLLPALAVGAHWTAPEEVTRQIGGKPYIIAHFLPWIAQLRKEASTVLDALDWLEREFKRRVVLMPITDYCGDNDAVRLMNSLADGRFLQLPLTLSFEERAKILMGADAFIGQSLHGAITAMAAGSPACICHPRAGGQKFFETFDDLGLGHLTCESYGDLPKMARRIANTNPTAIGSIAQNCRWRLDDYFDNLTRCLMEHANRQQCI